MPGSTMLGRTALALSLAAAATGAMAQSEPLGGVVEPFVVDATDGLPAFIVDSARACFLGAAHTLPPGEQQTLAAAPDFVAGVNAIVGQRPEAATALIPILDGCGGTIAASEAMWAWVRTTYAAGTEADRIALGTCLTAAIDALVLDAKLGISRFRFGDFADSIRAMQRERPDLLGTIVEDMAACGVTL